MREPLPSDAEPTTAAPDAHVEAVRNEHRSELADALAALPAQQREAVLLRDVRGFSYEEVAASLAVSTSAVESLLFRARSRLRAQLRTAYAAISGAGWIGPLRELLGTGGLAGAPVAAKAVAVGALGAVVAGGVVAPTVLEHRGPASPPPAPTRSTAQTHVAPQATQTPQTSAPPVVFSAATLPRPSAEDISSVGRRSIAGGEGEHATAAGDGSSAESQSGDGSASERQGGSTQSSGRGEGSGGETGGGEAGRSTDTATSSPSKRSGGSETETAPIVTLSTHSESSGESGDSSGQSPAPPSVQSDSSGSGDSGGGDGSDG